MVPKRIFMCTSINSNWAPVCDFLGEKICGYFRLYGHVDDFCQEVAGDDGCRTPALNRKILSHLLWRLNCMAEFSWLLHNGSTSG